MTESPPTEVDVHRGLAFGRRAGIAVMVTVAVILVMLTSRTVIITPDGRDYLSHAGDLMGTGLIQLGYRQVGYPLFLNLVIRIAEITGADPMSVVVIVQHLLMAVAAAVVAWCLRWWAVPVVTLLVVPAMAVYGSFILTEAIGIPIAAIGATATVAVVAGRHRARHWSYVAGAAALALPLIRLHWVVVSGGICLALLISAWDDRTTRRRTVAMVTGIGLAVGLFVGAIAVENRNENGILHPSLGAQRQLYWITWETVLRPNGVIAAVEVPDIYGGGSPWPFLISTDGAALPYTEREARYADAVDRMFEATGASPLGMRIASLASVPVGGRVDDLGLGENPGFALGAPSPSLQDVIRIALVASIIASAVGFTRHRSRPLAIAGTAMVGAYSILSFAYPLDNLRFLLPAYVAFTVFASGTAMLWWSDPSAERSRVHASADDRTRS